MASWPDCLIIDKCRDARLPLCCIGECMYRGLLCAICDLRSNCTNDTTVVTAKKEVITYIAHHTKVREMFECTAVWLCHALEDLKKTFCVGLSEIKIGQPRGIYML